MFLSDISIKRPIMMTMVLSVFLIFGGMAYFTLSLDMLPDVEIPVVTITTVYPGGNPSEIETQVTKKIEDAVSTISKIDYVRSFTMESVSLITIRFDMDKDVDIAVQETKDKVDKVLNDLPGDAETPIVEKFDLAAEPVVEVVLSGNLPLTDLYELADKKVKDRFAQISGVGKVDLVGGQEREIRVELDNRVVFQNMISVTQLNQILAAANMDMPGGNFQKRDQDYSARLQGKFKSIEELKNFEVPTVFGKKKLKNIANVKDAGEDIRDRTIYFNNFTKERNENVVLLSMVKSPDGNTVEIAEAIIESLPEIENDLPAGVKLNVVMDGSIFIKASVEDTLSNIGMGIILTALVLLFFLHDLRSTFIVAMAMPMAIISTFMLMQLWGYNLNVMTLMGLSTSVGILVANSVVVLENIFRYKEMGKDKKESAAKGTAEVVVAVLASTLTNIVVFLPIANMSSLAGQFFKEFAMTVTFATLFSLLISFTLTPMLSSLILPDRDVKKHRIGQLLEKLFKSWERIYSRMLEIVIKNRITSFVTILIAGGTFVLSVIVWGSNIGFEFFPMLDEGDIQIEVDLPQGYRLEETAKVLKEIETRLSKYPEVKQMLTTVGQLSQMDVGTNLAIMKVKLVNIKKRDIANVEAASLFIEELSDIPNAKIRVAAISSAGSNGESPYQFFLQGTDDKKLESIKEDFLTELKKVDGLVNLSTSSRSGKPEISIIPKRDKLINAGLTVYDIALTIRAAIEGITATTYTDAGEEYDIRLTFADESVDTPEELGNITVVSQFGAFRLSQLAEINFDEGNSKILHNKKMKAIQFTGNPAPGYPLGDIVSKTDQILAEYNFPSGYKIEWGGDVTMMDETTADMGSTFLIAMLLTYMLLAAILESFTQPLMILGTIPLAMVGVFGALYYSGLTMNMMSMMAIIMLIGIVVNNAILILDYTNILVRQGKKVKDALIEAAPTKLKPILMSTIAIILGMLPMALGIGSAGREFRQPLGVVSIGGLIVSTVMTLFVIPAIYELTHREKKIKEAK